jgi:predicted dienelactone hydrolase
MRFVAGLVLVGLLLGAGLPLAAQRPDAPLYAQAGPYAVGTRELRIDDATRPLNVTIWYPTAGEPGSEPSRDYPLLLTFTVPGHAYVDAAPLASATPYPLIVFSHGSGGSRVLSLFYTEHLASYGFIVIAADHPGNNVLNSGAGGILGNSQDFAGSYALRPHDVLRQIALAEDLNKSGDFAGLIDLEHIGVTGHSFGGWTALSAAGARLDFDHLTEWCVDHESSENVCFVRQLEQNIATERGLVAAPAGTWEATSDARIKAVVALAPWNAPSLNFDEITAPTLIIVGTGDAVTIPERDAYTVYANITAPKALLTLDHAGHYIFIDECPPVFTSVNIFDECADVVWDMPRAHDLTNHAATAFFLAQLTDDDNAAAALTQIEFPGVEFQRAE